MMADFAETDRIETDLARTRARMDRRLGELDQRLTPRQMLNDAFAHFRGGDGAEFTSDLITRVKANPIPVALTGVGIAWLMAAGSGTRATSSLPMHGHDDLEARLRMAEGNVHRFDDDDEASYASRLDDARGKVMGIARSASDTAASYAQRVKEAAASVGQSVRDKSHDLMSSTSGARARLGNRAGRHAAAIQEGTQDMARSTREALSSVASNPFALGAIAAAVGAVAGAMLPTLDREEEALGSMATKVRTAGRDLAQDVVDRGGRIANDTLDAVKDSAEAHGLTSDKPVGELISDVQSGDLLGDVKQVAQETLQAGRDSAKTHLGAEPKPKADETRS